MKNLRILLLEDEPATLITLKFMISKAGCILSKTAPSAEEALEYLSHNNEKIDLILSDINLQKEMNGLDLAAKTTKLYNIPTIFITSEKPDYFFDKINEINVVYYIEKPINYDSLHLALDVAKNKINREKIKAEETKKTLLDLTQKMSELDRIGDDMSRFLTLGEVASTIVHEINSPLSLIMNFCEELEDHSDPKVKKLAKKIKDTVEKISKIANGIKSLARPNKDDHPEEIEIDKVICNAIDLTKQKCQKFNVPLIYNRTIDMVVKIIPIQIEQAIVNLISNSVDAIKDDINEKWIKIELALDDSFYYIKVIDSGKMSKEVADKIFQPFFTTKKSGEGTGIGIGVTRKMIKRHNGELLLNIKRNTEFIIKLPLNDKK